LKRKKERKALDRGAKMKDYTTKRYPDARDMRKSNKFRKKNRPSLTEGVRQKKTNEM